jgi:hypothetical protein
MFDSLRESIYLSLKSKRSWYMGKGFKMHFGDIRVLAALRQLCYRDQDALDSNSVWPRKCTDPKVAPLSSMPVYGFRFRHVQFDERTFLPLLRKAYLFLKDKDQTRTTPKNHLPKL